MEDVAGEPLEIYAPVPELPLMGRRLAQVCDASAHAEPGGPCAPGSSLKGALLCQAAITPLVVA
jgi:hypothetical protein